MGCKIRRIHTCHWDQRAMSFLSYIDAMIEINEFIQNNIFDQMIEITLKSPQTFQLYAAAKTYHILSQNEHNLSVKTIEFASKIILEFGHLLMHKFDIGIVAQFDRLNQYHVGNDSKELTKIYEQFTIKYPEYITKDTITKANNDKEYEQKTSTETESESLLLTIEDVKGNNITIVPDISPNDTLQTLKDKISEIGGYKPESQILYIGDTKIEQSEDGDDKLSAYNIQDGDTLRLIVKYRNDAHEKKMNFIERYIIEDYIQYTDTFWPPFFVLMAMLLLIFVFGAGVDLSAMIMASEKTKKNNKCAVIGVDEGNLALNPADFLTV